MKKLLSPLVVLGLLVASLAAAPSATAGEPVPQSGQQAVKAAVAGYTPAAGAIFNHPMGPPDQQQAIMNHLLNSVDSTPAGATIRVAVYSFSFHPMGDALIAAFRRGVNVQLLIDDHAKPRTDVNLKLRSVLNKNKTDSSFVTTCKYGCMSSKPSFMHAKIYMFSRTGNAKYVTMASSANPAYGAASASWNNIYTTVNDRVTYESNKKYISDMRPDKTNTKYYRTTTSGNVRTYFFPRAGTSNKSDNQYQVLGGVDCKAAVPAGFGKNGKTVVRVTAYRWTNLRAYIATRLAAMKKAGCDVEVVYPSNVVETKIPPALLNAGIPTWDTAIDVTGDKVPDLYAHSKFISINGMVRNTLGASRPTKVVYTGAPNFTMNSLRQSNENMIRVTDAGVTAQFEANFEDMKVWSVRVTRAKAKALSTQSSGSASDPKADDYAIDPNEDE